MTKNNNIEEILRDRMNVLSDTVDCFDRISQRVFPETSNGDFSLDDDIIISNVENVTSKSRNISIIKWTSFVAAAILCIAVVPKMSFVQRVFSDVKDSNNNKEFKNLISEMNSRISEDYSITEYPLEQYISDYYVYSPFYSCPFEDKGISDVTVRLYVLQVNGYDTNDMYAVEYRGDYCEENIIAVADTGIRFNEDDMSKAVTFEKERDFEIDPYGFRIHIEGYDDFVPYIYGLSDEYVNKSDERYIYMDDDSDEQYINEQNDILKNLPPEDIMRSSIKSYVLKNGDTVMPVTSVSVFLDDTYDYSVISCGEETEYKGTWEKSVYYNGKSAFPENPEDKQSDFVAPYRSHYKTSEEYELEIEEQKSILEEKNVENIFQN